MAIDDNTLYGLTGAQVKEMVQRRGNTEISQEPSTYGNEGESLSLDSNGTSGHLRVGVDIMNDGSEGFLYLNDSYPGIRFPSNDVMYQAINDALPVNVSELYNDAGYQSASQVSSAIASATSQYYTKTEVDTALGAKANSADVYTKTQADTLLNAKQNTLTAGSNVQIVNDTISATDTTYSDFTGTDGTTAGAAGLVPAPATTDAGKFLKADGTWDTAGSAINVVQTTGTSTTDVMSQNAVTGMIFNDPGSYSNVAIGTGVSTSAFNNVVLGRNAVGGSLSVAIGGGVASSLSARATGNYTVAIGANSTASASYSIALGSGSRATVNGQFDVSASGNSGYNNSNYRLLTGLYDPQSVHDAATKGYVDTAVAGAGASAFTTNEWNALWA